MAKTLHQWIVNQRERSCAWCGVSLAISAMTFGLMFAHLWGHS